MNFLVSFLEIYTRLFAQKNTFVDEYKISANSPECCIYNPPALPNQCSLQSRFQVPRSSFVQSIRFTSSTTNDRSVSAEEMESLLELMMTLIDKINENCKEPSSKGSNGSRSTKNERELITDESKSSQETDDDKPKDKGNNESGPTDEGGLEKPIDIEDDPKDNGNGEGKPNCDDRTGASLDIIIDDDDTGPEDDVEKEMPKNNRSEGAGPMDDDGTGKPIDDNPKDRGKYGTGPEDDGGTGKPADNDSPKDGDGTGKPIDKVNPKDRGKDGTGPEDGDGSGEPIGDDNPKADGSNDGMVSLGTKESMVNLAEYDSKGACKPNVAVQNV